LQVLAVDNIVQAADIAFIDRDELDKLETLFVSRGRFIANILSQGYQRFVPNVYAIFVKDPDELEMELVSESQVAECKTMFLVHPQTRGVMLSSFPWLGQDSRLLDFDPSTESLTPLLQRLERSWQRDLTHPFHLSLVAPYFLLIQDGINLDTLVPDPTFKGMKLFANNYTLQGSKIKRCKAMLNRVFSFLSMLDADSLEECPFLTRHEGVYVVDVSFIPEKYRLDFKRVEQILCRFLGAWMREVTGRECSC
jgi:ATP-dependent Lon protease